MVGLGSVGIWLCWAGLLTWLGLEICVLLDIFCFVDLVGLDWIRGWLDLSELSLRFGWDWLFVRIRHLVRSSWVEHLVG